MGAIKGSYAEKRTGRPKNNCLTSRVRVTNDAKSLRASATFVETVFFVSTIFSNRASGFRGRVVGCVCGKISQCRKFVVSRISKVRLPGTKVAISQEWDRLSAPKF